MESYEKTLDFIETEFNIDNTDNATYAAAVKCTFIRPKVIMGAFCVLLRKHDLKIVESVFWTTKFVSVEKVELPTSFIWEDFLTKIPSIGPIDRESCEKLQITLKNSLSSETIENLFNDNESSTGHFSKVIRENIESRLRYSIKLDLEFEPSSQDRLKSSGYEREKVTISTNTESVSMTQIIAEQIDTSQTINCTAIVDPVNGIAASELRAGDIVEVVIPTNSTIGTLLSDYYARLKKVPAYPVEKTSVSDNGSYIINLLADGGISCVVKAASGLKLRARKCPDENSISTRSFMIISGFSMAIFILGVSALIRLLIR
jgi:hypothetical protein